MSASPEEPSAGRDGDVEPPVLGLDALERLDDGVFVIDRSWRLVFMNSAAERFVGRRRADVLGKDLWSEFPEAVGTEFERRYRLALERQESVEFVERHPPSGRALRLRLLPSPRGLTVIYRDVTDQVEQERRLRLTQEIAHIGTWEWDATTGESTWTEEVYRILGLDPRTTVPSIETSAALVHPEDLPGFEEAMRRAQARREPFSLVHRIVRPDGAERVIHGRGVGTYAEDGTLVRMTGTLHDVTEGAETARRLERAQEIAHMGVWEWHIPTGELTWTAEIFRIFGEEPWSFAPDLDWFMARVHPDDRAEVEGAVEQALTTGAPYLVEHRVVRPDGGERIVREQAEVRFGPDGTPVRMTGAVLDVTEQALAERALRDSERLLEQAREIAGLDVYVMDVRTGRALTVSEGMTEGFGIGPGSDFAEGLALVHPEDRHVVEAAFARMLEDGEPFDVMNRIVRPGDGTEIWLRNRAQRVGDRVIGTFLDVTEQVELERRLTLAQQIARIGTWEWVVATGELRWTDEVYRMHGLDPGGERITHQTYLERIHPDDRQTTLEAGEAALAGAGFEVEHRVIWPDGTERILRGQGRARFGPDGAAVSVTGTVHDVTERVAAERALRESEMRLAQAQEIAGLSVWTLDPATGATETSPEIQRLFEIGPGDGIAEALPRIHPDHVDEVAERFDRTLRTGEPFAMTYPLRRPSDGTERWVRSHAQVVDDLVIGTIMDITEQVESERSLARAQEIALMATWEYDVLTDRLEVTDEFYRSLGVAPRSFDLTFEGLLERIHAEDRASVRAATEAMLRDDAPLDVTYRLVRPDGTERIIRARGEVVARAPDGASIRALGNAMDITDRELAARALRRSEERFRHLAAAAPVGMLETDAAEACVWVNDRWCEIVGAEAADALGAGWVAMIHPEDRDGVLLAWRTAARAGTLFAREFRLLGPGGRVAHVEGRAVTAAEGPEAGRIATIVDVTERRRREREHAALSRIATAVAGEETPRSVFALVAAQIADALEVDACTVLQADPVRGDAVVVGGWASLAAGVAPGERMSLEAGLLGSMRRSGAPVRTSLPEEVAPFAGAAAGESRTAAAVATPVWTGKTLWGAIVVTRAGALAGGRAEEHLERVANLLSLALAGADARRQLAMLASTDHLTGLPNRRSFEERLAAEVQRAGRHDRPLALVVFDIDNFKEINDTWGHEVGDRVLVELASRLAAHARSGETVARIGGEEFAWILPEADAMGAIAAAERASRAIAATPFDDVGVVTVSGGVCDLEQAPGANELFRSADVALYWAKAQGRNAVFRYAPEVVELLSAEEQRDRLQRAQTLGGIRAIAQAIDAKDTATQRHSERVATLAHALALEDGWHPDDAARVREAALVHDVGKIGVPDVVLMKPGRLTAQEYAQIQEHPELGARMVEGLLSDECVPWVRHHHERWDGEGYPAGLAGPEIPKGARILALADALDAMVMARPYAPRLTIDDAVREARACAGTQFDPQVVTLLERLHGSGRLPEAEQPVPPPEGVGTPLVDPTATAERP